MSEKHTDRWSGFLHYLYGTYTTYVALGAVTASLTLLVKYSTSDIIRPILFGVAASVSGGVLAYAVLRFRRHISGQLPAVFVSYSHLDRRFVDKLIEEFSQFKIRILIDQVDLKVGDDIRSAVGHLIDSSDYFVVVVSENTMKSGWAQKEIEQANKRNKKILPVVLDVDAIPSELAGIYYADFTSDFEVGINQLKQTFRSNEN